MWACAFCGCPHGEMPDGEGTYFLVAFEPRECPKSFEEPCPECGQVYACLPGCEYIGPLSEMADAIIITENSD